MGRSDRCIQHRGWCLSPHEGPIPFLRLSRMANLWRNRCGGRFMRSHQYVCALESIVHLDPSHEVPLAFRDRHFNHPSHYHDRGITARERQDCMGMRPWRPALDCNCRIRCPSFGFLAHWLLCSRVLESQYCLHRFTSGGHRLPGLHVLFDLAILKAARALLEYARAFPRRVLQGLSAWYYLADVGHHHPLSPVWHSLRYGHF